MGNDKTQSRRIDQWLWYARQFKSRSQASKFCSDKKIRLDGQLVSKASTLIHIGSTLTFVKNEQIKVVKILDIGKRRGPASEAEALYQDLSPPPQPAIKGSAQILRDRGAGRPTKAERRALEKLRPELKQ